MENEKPDLVYVAELAKRMGKTKAAIRRALSRKVKWLPPRFNMGGKGSPIAWLRSDVDKFFQSK